MPTTQHFNSPLVVDIYSWAARFRSLNTFGASKFDAVDNVSNSVCANQTYTHTHSYMMIPQPKATLEVCC